MAMTNYDAIKAGSVKDIAKMIAKIEDSSRSQNAWVDYYCFNLCPEKNDEKGYCDYGGEGQDEPPCMKLTTAHRIEAWLNEEITNEAN